MIFNLIAFLASVTLTVHTQHTNNQGAVWMGACTAVYVSPSTALTAAHCFKPTFTGKAWVRDNDKKSFSATVIFKDVDSDLALIRVKGPAHPYVKLGDLPTRGQRVYSYNSGNDIPGNYVEGIVSNVFKDGELHNTIMTLHTAPIQMGASGSGLFDKHGRLVGINTITMGALSEAVHPIPILEFLMVAQMAAQV